MWRVLRRRRGGEFGAEFGFHSRTVATHVATAKAHSEVPISRALIAIIGGHSLRHRPKRAPFSAAVDAAIFGLSRRHFGGYLWTLRMAECRLSFSDGPTFSRTLYFSDLVQSLKNPYRR